MIAKEDKPLRYDIYQHFAETGHAPTIGVLAKSTGKSEAEIQEGFQRLHQGHAILLATDGHTILMANPFAGTPTEFQVTAGNRRWWANCIWDAFGVLVCLGQSGEIKTRCPQSGTELRLQYNCRESRGDRGIVHFDRPFRRWYDNLVET